MGTPEQHETAEELLERLGSINGGDTALTTPVLRLLADESVPVKQRLAVCERAAEVWSADSYGSLFAKRVKALREEERQKKVAARRAATLNGIEETSDQTELRQAAKLAEERGATKVQIAALRRLLELDETPGNLAQFGAAMRRMGKLAEAIRALERSVALDDSKETNEVGFTALGAALRERAGPGDLSLAQSIAAELLEIHPRSPYVLALAGGIESDLGNYRRAEELLVESRRHYPRAGGPRNELRRLAERYGRKGDAKARSRVLALLDG